MPPSSLWPTDIVDAEVIKTRLEAIEAAVERIEGKLDAVLAALEENEGKR